MARVRSPRPVNAGVDKVVTANLRIRSANPADADELLAIRRDAIMALAEEYGRMAAERWATAAHPDRATEAIASNSVWVTECGSKVVGWVEVRGATIESLYVSSAAACRGVGSALLAHAERHIRDAGASVAYLDASPNAEAFYARRGYRRVGEVKANNSIPMSKRVDLM
jgi:putative acetyltransferase